ncbi:energy-coupling factor transporter transmembrane component T family protein [Paenibacillus campinasensis]|uniref:Cobalt transporter n=1 Tax=Paenibacillus campinasensis TaxID=66347 RepID=A0A268EZA6_9BACL|nr:energy-coupling factor transporter transmembrane component T [Paenibacillus campinasensis]PAD78450.1 cobalt transporter [Paenibacillus campinasensis]
MQQRMIFGRYIEGNSWVHGLDPRAKTVAMLLFMTAVFMVNNYAGVLALLLFTLAVMKGSGIPLRYFIRAVKPLMFLLVFIFLFHLFYGAGGTQLLDVGAFKLYAGGLEKGVVSASRMLLFVMFAALLTFTTVPDRLAEGLGFLLRPLKAIRVPTDRLVLMLSISLRFIPTIFEEAERLWKSQVSRGLSFQGRPLSEKARLAIALLVPVTAGAFRRALGLADSMEARGYRLGAERTLLRALSWSRTDTLFLGSFLLPIAALGLL